MSLKRSSNKMLYTALDTAKPLWLLTLPYLALTLYNELQTIIGHFGDIKLSLYVKPTTPLDSGFFYNRMTFMLGAIPYFLFILWACAFGMAAFSFLASKKKSNVYFSLGINKKDLFLGKFLGGLLPLATSIIFAHIVNLVCNCIMFKVTHGLIVMWLFDTFAFLFTMLCAYSVAVLAFVNACNIAEGIVFTGLFGISSPIITSFIESFAIGNLVFGSPDSSYYYNTGINYTQKLWFLDIFGSYTECTGRYYDSLQDNTVFELNGMQAILGIVVGAIAFVLISVLAYLFFKKRTSETAGTILRSYNLYKIFFVLLSVIVFCFSIDVFSEIMLSRYVCALLGTLLALLCILVGNLIFVRKIPVKTIAVAAVLYVGFAVCCFIGYNNPVPKAEDVKSAKVCSSVFYPDFRDNSDSRIYSHFTDDAFCTESYDKFYHIILEDKDDIAWLLDVHSSIVGDGYIARPDEDASPICFAVEYTLNDGTKVSRIYNFASSKTREKILGFGKTKAGKELNSYFFSEENPYISNNYGGDGSLVDDIYYGGESHEKYFGYIKNFKDPTSNYENDIAPLGCIQTSNDTYNAVVVDKLGAYVGELGQVKFGEEFIETLRNDLENRTVEQKYFHSPSDEVCELYFINEDNISSAAYWYAENNFKHLVGNGNYETIAQVGYALVEVYSSGVEIRNGNYLFVDGYVDEYDNYDYEYIIEKDSYEYNLYTHIFGKNPKKGDFEKFAAMLEKLCRENREEINKYVFSNGEIDSSCSSIVITKDMVNTINLIEESGIDLSSVKTSEKIVKARIAKFDDVIDKVTNGGIKNLKDVYWLYRSNKDHRYSAEEPENILGDNYITDPEKINYLSDNSFIFYGKAFGNYVVEFILEDGTQVSKLVSAEKVKDIL